VAISYNTGTTAFVTNSATNHGTITIPAGVNVNDVVIVYVFGFAVSASTSGGVTLTSTATAPTAVGSTQFLQSTNPGIAIVGQPFYIVAGASDPGATLTYTFTGITSSQYWFDVGLVAYTGASTTAPIDCQNGSKSFSGTGTGAITTPSTTTVTSGDWQIQLIGQDPAGSPTVVTPGGLTSRQVIATATNAGVLLNIADSNASVGAGGTGIGGTSWTVTGSTSGNTWQTAFTIGLAPASGAAAPAGSVQPRATVPAPRRQLARAYWHGGQGQAFVAVPAPRQQPRLAPRRIPARALWRGGAGQAFVFVPAPRQQPAPAPRRKLARAYVRFTPVTTVNAAAATVSGTIPALMANQTRTAVRRDGRVVRH
jgi:hypothetical protein